MTELNKILHKKKIAVSLDGVDAEVVYHIYKGYKLNTLLVSFKENRRVLSTLDGYQVVPYVANNYAPYDLSLQTMNNYPEFRQNLPLALVIDRKSIGDFEVCCFATAGAKGNALRTGVDVASYVETPGHFMPTHGTINVIILTNSTLSVAAMARAMITVTEAKTAVLEDLKVRSTSSPQLQATGTGTDNIIIVSGNVGEPLLLTTGHSKMGELIGHSTKIAVVEALKKHDG
jgi:adenosylcobinamide amidohydrolase